MQRSGVALHLPDADRHLHRLSGFSLCGAWEAQVQGLLSRPGWEIACGCCCRHASLRAAGCTLKLPIGTSVGMLLLCLDNVHACMRLGARVLLLCTR